MKRKINLDNKTNKIKRLAAILQNYRTQPIMKEDKDFVLKELQNHYAYKIETQSGIKDIIVAENNAFGFYSYGFNVIMNNGDVWRPSYKKIYNPPQPIDYIKRAARYAVKNVIEEFRNNSVEYGFAKCPITNQVLTKGNTDIDHYDLTFKDLFDKWMEDKNPDEVFNCVFCGTNDDLTIKFTDNNLLNSFVSFHNNNTHLRAVTRFANRSILKRKIPTFNTINT